TLTLPAGSVLKFTGRPLVVNGTVESQGTAQNPVYLTSFKDDSVGGDTNNDSGANPPAANDWDGVQVNSGQLDLAYTTVSYTHQAISNTNGSVTLTNSTLANNAANLLHNGGSTTLNGSSVSGYGGGSGVLANNGGTLAISNTTFVAGSGTS